MKPAGRRHRRPDTMKPSRNEGRHSDTGRDRMSMQIWAAETVAIVYIHLTSVTLCPWDRLRYLGPHRWRDDWLVRVSGIVHHRALHPWSMRNQVSGCQITVQVLVQIPAPARNPDSLFMRVKNVPNPPNVDTGHASMVGHLWPFSTVLLAQRAFGAFAATFRGCSFVMVLSRRFRRSDHPCGLWRRVCEKIWGLLGRVGDDKFLGGSSAERSTIHLPSWLDREGICLCRWSCLSLVPFCGWDIG